MSAIGISLVWCAVQITLLGIVGGALYVAGRRSEAPPPCLGRPDHAHSHARVVDPDLQPVAALVDRAPRGRRNAERVKRRCLRATQCTTASDRG